MIARMKKISILLYHRDRDLFLRGLQGQGVVHVVERSEKDLSDSAITTESIKRCESFLASYRNVKSPAIGSGTAEKIVERFEGLRTEEARLQAERGALAKDRDTFVRYGNFDPAIVRSLGRSGVHMGLFTTATRRFEALDRANLAIEVITQTPRDVAFVCIWRDARPQLDAEEIRIPELDATAIDEKDRALAKRLQQIEGELAEIGKSCGAVAVWCRELRDTARFQSVRGDLDAPGEGRLLALNGWFPARKEQALTAWLLQQQVWFECSQPAADDDVPVKLENDAFSKLLEPITRLYMLPNYRELDPTPFFAPAFAFFVGLCLGDVGYGAIIVALATTAWFKAPEKFRPMSMLLIILGCMVIACGVILNSFFGMSIFGGPGITGAIFPTGAQYFSPLSPYEGAQGTNYPAMSFALVIGFLQMIFAMVLQMVNRIRQGSLRTIILPISWMMMFVGIVIWEAHTDWYALGVNGLEVGRLKVGPMIVAIPEIVGKVVCLGGVGLMLASSVINGSGNVAVRPLLFLWDFYNFATGNMGYLISYIRLFALGLTGGLLGATFNGLAIGFITHNGVVNWLSPMVVCTVLLLLVGHALNFGLSVVGAFVHPLRLTFVEFYQTLQFAGGGKEFKPFARSES